MDKKFCFNEGVIETKGEVWNLLLTKCIMIIKKM